MAMLATAVTGLWGSSLPGPQPSDHAEPGSGVRIWEAHAKGFVTITQVEAGGFGAIGYRVANSGNRTVVHDEYVYLMSPHPVLGPFGTPPPETTQDGVLENGTVPAFGSRTYIYGDLVVSGTMPGEPMWFCTEANEVVQPNVEVLLGGEILPFALTGYVENATDTSQASIWSHIERNPTVVVGKTPLVKALTGLANETFEVRVSATNVSPFRPTDGITPEPHAPDATVRDTVPAGWGWKSPSKSPSSVQNNGDGSVTLSWVVNLPAVDVTGHDNNDPPAYSNEQITYVLVTPEGLTGGRMYLPRAEVDTDADGDIDAHSAEPLLEIAQANRRPSVSLGGLTGVEGSPVSIAALASDPDGDALTYSFDFQDDGVFDVVQPGSTTAFTWFDDHVGTVRVRVSDGQLQAEAVAAVTIANANPALTHIAAPAEEGSALTLHFHLTDPGSDDLRLEITWGDGASEALDYLLGATPDPPESHEDDIHPDIIDQASHVFGDDAVVAASLRLLDDDGGQITAGASLVIFNGEPVATLAYVDGGEGEALPFTATATDPGSDDIEFFWDWEDGSSESRTVFNDGLGPDPDPSFDGAFPFTAVDATTHAWGDNGVFVVTLTVTDDDGGVAVIEQPVTVLNRDPALSAIAGSVPTEGDSVEVTADAEDPGSDDLTLSWAWAFGPSQTVTFFNDGVGPDPPRSPWGTWPFAVSDAMTHTYGDDGVFPVSIEACDDDGGCTAISVDVTVLNAAPTVSLLSIPTGPEGVNVLRFEATATDPGSDDVTFGWWGHCQGWSPPTVYLNEPAVGTDPDPSPDIHPRVVTDSQSIVCGDNGVLTWNLRVEDDDGGLTEVASTFTVDNVPPSLTVAPPVLVGVDEGTAVTLDATASDPGSDDLTFTWQWDYGPTETRTVFNDGLGPDPFPSPEGTFPFTASDSSTLTYGDDCSCVVTLSVADDDGGSLTYRTTVEVANVAPVLALDVYAVADITLRVAGEKWHDIRMDLLAFGAVTASAHVVRYPGSPDRQIGTIDDGRISLLGDARLVLYYTPDDDPVNGQRNGDNPVWVILDFPNGKQERLFHNFNVQHPDTWVWTLDDFWPLLVGVDLTFEMTGSDVGSDDEIFAIDFADGATFSHTVFNDGLGPDPFPSPDVNPITATVAATHAYAAAGAYTVTVTLADDDGGSVTQVVTMTPG